MVSPATTSQANNLADAIVAAGVCAYGECSSLAVDKSTAFIRSRGVPPGLCKFHTMRAEMDAQLENWPLGTGKFQDSEPYIKWVRAALDSGVLTYREMSLSGVTGQMMSDLTGISRHTITNLRKGAFKKIQTRTANMLDPYVALTTPHGPVAGFQAGDRVDRAQLARLPKGTVVLDKHRRAWQLRDGASKRSQGEWYAAHGQDRPTTERAAARFSNLSSGPNFPATILWIPGVPVSEMQR